VLREQVGAPKTRSISSEAFLVTIEPLSFLHNIATASSDTSIAGCICHRSVISRLYEGHYRHCELLGGQFWL
jgi:hypothetical protein